MGVTDEHKSILLHALGVQPPWSKRPSRDYYCTSAGDPVLEGMVSMGLMWRGGIINDGRDQYYFVTDAGAEAVGHKLPG